MIQKVLFISIGAGLVATSLFAQGPRRPMGAGPMGPGDFALVRAEFGMTNKVVSAAPYSAQAVTQFTQALSNGDHIQRTTTASVARDSQGRTRMDRSLSTVGALSSTARGPARAILIHDPVAGVSYALDPESHIARSMQIPAARAANADAHVPRSFRSAKTEDLGTQVTQGVSAQGKRITRAIPAGQEGNEREIDIVSESWYSPDLQVVVMSKTSDPRFGETTYQLNGITRVEPDPALFTVPSGYTVREGRPLRRSMPVPAAQ